MGAALIAVGLLAAACGSSSSTATTTTAASSGSTSSTASGSSGSSGTVAVASVSGVGRVLVDSQGRTLYLFTPDKQSASTCTGACAAAWMPLMATGTPSAGSGVSASLLGTVHNPNGTVQVTYNHWPLYTFIGDTAAGQARGQGLSTFGGHWTALTSSGASATASTSSGSSTSSSSGGNGY